MKVLKNQFDEVMRREGHTVQAYTNNTSFRCFFRRMNDNANQRDTMQMFYPASISLHSGNLLTYKGEHFLMLNQETTENSVYLKSAIIRTNGELTTHTDSVCGLPFYADGINNSLGTDNGFVSLLNGNVELLTEDNAASRALRIDDLFNEWGRTWKIKNLFYIDGTCHVMSEVAPDEEPVNVYTLTLSALAALDVKPGDTDVLTLTAYHNENVVDADIAFASSNDEIATIDENGNIEYLTAGEVYFTATWEAHNVSEQTETVTVTEEASGNEVKIYVQSLAELCYNLPETLTYYATVGGVRDDTIPVSFAIENLNASATLAKKLTVVDNGDHTITLECTNSNLIGKTFDLVGSNAEYGIENRQTLKIESFF